MTVDLWRRYARSFEGSILRLISGATLSLLAGLALVPIPLIVGYAFDRVIPSRDMALLAWLALALLALQILSSVCTLVTRVIVLSVTKQAVTRLRREGIAKLFSVSRSYLGRHTPSALHNLLVQGTERIDVMSVALVAEVAPAIVLSLGICVVLFRLNWWLFLTMAAVLPVNVVAARLLGRRVRSRTRRFHSSFEHFSRGVLFVVRAADLTRIKVAEQAEAARQGDRIEDLRQSSASVAAAGTTYTVVQQTLIVFAAVVVLLAGGRAVTAGVMTAGRLLSFFAGLMLFRLPLHTILTSLPRIIEGVQSLAAVIEFLDDDDRGPYVGTTAVAFTGRVALEDVSFSYGDRPVLEQVSLTLTPGETVALIGPNGSGKSTIVNLILGFYRPQQGSVFADGVPFDDVDIRALRREIGVVMQDAIMVPGTIRDNLLYGVVDEPWEAVLDVCRRTGVSHFVARLPLGYDTPIGEDGESLSGGQRQRLSIARALLARPKLLILDEPMNHLDEANGPEFLRRLTAGSKPPAILLISHRPDVVSVADRVVRLEEGRVVAVEQAVLTTDASAAGRGW